MDPILSSLPKDFEKSFKKVSTEKIFDLWLSGKMGVVAKIGETYYLLSSNRMRAAAKYILGKHMCSQCDMFCDGVCPKVLDASKETLEFEGYEPETAVSDSKRIEKYPFVTKGIEAFNSKKSYFIVAECTRFKKLKDRKEL